MLASVDPESVLPDDRVRALSSGRWELEVAIDAPVALAAKPFHPSAPGCTSRAKERSAVSLPGQAQFRTTGPALQGGARHRYPSLDQQG